MRIDKVHIRGQYKNLRDFDINLDQSKMETVLLGQNASGKSNFMEALILIFKYLDLSKPTDRKSPPFDYSITYRCRNRTIEVEHRDKQYILFVNGAPVKPTVFFEQANKNEYLPKYVFTYYSGVSNRLREHFDDHQRNFYSRIIRDEVGHDELDDLRRLFYVQLVHSYFVLLAYFSFEQDEQDSVQFLSDVLGIEDIESVLFKLHEPGWNGSGTDTRFWKAKGLVQELLATVWDQSIAPIRNQEEDPNKDFRSKSRKKEFLYLYISNKAKLQALAREYKTNTGFFKALESTYISDLIEEVRVKVKKRNVAGNITFRELSEGEQQLLTVMGLLKFTKDKDSLILLDEPDTHLNPLWKWQYLDFLRRVVGDEDATQILINTHDPLVIGSLTKEQVRMFRVHPHTGHVTATQPDIDPRGLGVAGILTSELFGLPSVLDRPTLDLLQERNELLYKQDHQQLDDSGQRRLQELFLILNRKGFARIDKDPLYEQFLRAYAERTELLTTDNLYVTKEQREAQDRIALDILDELFREEQAQ